MPALFVWRNRRPARALWSGLFRIHDKTWRTPSPAPSAAPWWPGCEGGATPVPKWSLRRSCGPRAGQGGAGSRSSEARARRPNRFVCGRTSYSAPDVSWSWPPRYSQPTSGGLAGLTPVGAWAARQGPAGAAHEASARLRLGTKKPDHMVGLIGGVPGGT